MFIHFLKFYLLFSFSVNECPDISVLIQNENVSSNNSLLKVISNSKLVGDSVSFMCPLGYGLIGNEEITCLETGEWSGAIPSCQGKKVLITHLNKPLE